MKNNKWRFNFGVTVDTLGNVSAKILSRVNDVRKQCNDLQYQSLNDTINAEQQRYNANGWFSTRQKIQTSILRHVKGIMILSYNYSTIKALVSTALYAGTPVWIFSPYKTPDMVHPTSIDEWYKLCNAEHAGHVEYAKEQDYMNQTRELDNQLVYVLNQPCTWLDPKYTRLYKMLSEFPDFEAFMLYVNAVIDDIEDEGEWDLEVTSTPVQNQRANVYTYISTSGKNKGLRVSTGNGDFGTWINYEVLPADTLTKFLSLTFYKAMGIKPLKRVMTNGADYVLVTTNSSIPEEEFMLTPIYVEQN